MNNHKEKNIIFTGGGSGGHVMPAITLIQELKKDSSNHLFYIGGKGIEKELIDPLKIPYRTISTGKLRRYFSWENILDFFRIIQGAFQAVNILVRFDRKNTLIFSTGGFVAVPVVLAAWFTRKKIFIHEQTGRVGLA
ncbi:MAG: glycosyltransferase, partial [Pseudomonadota bacterium]